MSLMFSPRVCVFVLVVLLAVVGSANAQKVAFVTSVVGPGDLSLWPDAQAVGASGIGAGNAICRARALAAGLDEWQTFVAWLSNNNYDAYCRLHGINGTVGGSNPNCGQATLPADAGPWVRTDGVPFAAEITQMLSPNGVVYTPVLLDEFGQPGSQFYHWTGTSDTGEQSTGYPEACDNWTSSSILKNGDVGRSTRTTAFWTWSDATSCNQNLRLLCLQGGGAGPPLPPVITDERVAFLTSTTGTGNLSLWYGANGGTNITAGNNICRTLAADAGLENPTSFKAWLSSAAVDAKDRFVHDGRWVRPDGIKIADSIADLFDGELFTSINVMETGEYHDSWILAWTGSDVDGTLAESCSNWAVGTDASQGRVGMPVDATSYWTSIFTRDCDSNYHLYCFSDVPSNWLFGDDFESQDTGAWSAAVGGS